jgi:hypothetical protein
MAARGETSHKQPRRCAQVQAKHSQGPENGGGERKRSDSGKRCPGRYTNLIYCNISCMIMGQSETCIFQGGVPAIVADMRRDIRQTRISLRD